MDALHSPPWTSSTLPPEADYQSILASLSSENLELPQLAASTEKAAHVDHEPMLPSYLLSLNQSAANANGAFRPPPDLQNSTAHNRPVSVGQMAFSTFAQSPFNSVANPSFVGDQTGLADALHTAAYRDGKQFTLNSSASSLLAESSWEDDGIFTPLLSPALTAMSSVMGSTFQSLDTQKSHSNPSSVSHVAPSEFFSPLTSPALRPQPNGEIPLDQINNPILQQLIEQASLLGIMDGRSQAQAAAAFVEGQRHVLQTLGFTSTENLTAALQKQLAVHLKRQNRKQDNVSSADSSSGNSISSASGIGPPVVSATALKAANSSKDTSKGRGASRTAVKSRPSPIIRPANKGGSRKNSAIPPLSMPNSASISPAFPPTVFRSTGLTPLNQALLECPSPVDLETPLYEQATPIVLDDTTIPVPQPVSSNHTTPGFSPMTPASMMNINEFHLFSTVGQSANQMSHDGMSAVSQPSPDIDIIEASASTSPTKGKKQARKAAPALAKTQKARVQRKSAQNARAATAAAEIDDDEGFDDRKLSHKHAEQRRRDSLKQCFEELRHILPHIPPEEDEEAPRRPGEGNVGGQRSGTYDPSNPNKGVSKVALLRKSNEYIGKLRDRVDRRDLVLERLRDKLASMGVVMEAEELDDLNLDNLDQAEEGAWPDPKQYDVEFETGDPRQTNPKQVRWRSTAHE